MGEIRPKTCKGVGITWGEPLQHAGVVHRVRAQLPWRRWHGQGQAPRLGVKFVVGELPAWGGETAIGFLALVQVVKQ